MGLIKRLYLEGAVTNELENGLTEKITENLNNILSSTEVRASNI